MDDELWPVHHQQPLALWSEDNDNGIDGCETSVAAAAAYGNDDAILAQQPPGCNTPLACSPPPSPPLCQQPAAVPLPSSASSFPLLSPPSHSGFPPQQQQHSMHHQQQHQFMVPTTEYHQNQQHQFGIGMPLPPHHPQQQQSTSSVFPYWSSPASTAQNHNQQRLQPPQMMPMQQQQHPQPNGINWSQQQPSAQSSPLYCAIPPPPPYPHHYGSSNVVMAHNQHRQFDQQHQQAFIAAGPAAAAANKMMAHQQQNQRHRAQPTEVVLQRTNNNSNNRSLAAQQKVQQWQQFGTGAGLVQPMVHDSGVHSMSQSTANSVMSMSSLHPVSCISAVSSLPDEFSSLQEHPYFRHMPVSIRNEEPEKMRKVLPELIPLISDESEEIVLKALTILCSIARKDEEHGMGLICEKRVVEELFKTLRTQKKNKKIAAYVMRTLFSISCNELVGRELIIQTLETYGTDCLQELVHCIGIQEYSCFKYALLSLHDLITDARIGHKVIAYCCEMRVLTKVLGWLDDKNEKFLNVVTDIVDKLVTKKSGQQQHVILNSEQMAILLGLNGHKKLTNILLHGQQETLLVRVVKLLCSIANMDAEKLVTDGLLEAAQKHLDHASQRLLLRLLKCIRAVSDVRCQDRQIQPLLHRVLQLLGTNDLRLKESCMDILANLSANNAQNKEFLVNNAAIPSVFQLLHEFEALDQAVGAFKQRDEIQVRALVLLKSLCTGNERAGQARRQLLGNAAYKRLLLHKLMGEQRSLELLRRMLMLLLKLSQDELDVPLLRFSLPPTTTNGTDFFPNNKFPPLLPDAPMVQQQHNCRHQQQQHCPTASFGNQTVRLLQQTILGSGAGGGNSTALAPEAVEICQHCLDILRSMARDGVLCEEIFSELMALRVQIREAGGAAGPPRVMLPQALACFYDELAPGAIALIAELARIPEAAHQLQLDQCTLDCLQQWAQSETRTAQLAYYALQRISDGSGGAAGCKTNNGNGGEGRRDEGIVDMDGVGAVTQRQIAVAATTTSDEDDDDDGPQLVMDDDGREGGGGEQLSSSVGLNNSPASALANHHQQQQMDFSPAPTNAIFNGQITAGIFDAVNHDAIAPCSTSSMNGNSCTDVGGYGINGAFQQQQQLQQQQAMMQMPSSMRNMNSNEQLTPSAFAGVRDAAGYQHFHQQHHQQQMMMMKEEEENQFHQPLGIVTMENGGFPYPLQYHHHQPPHYQAQQQQQRMFTPLPPAPPEFPVMMMAPPAAATAMPWNAGGTMAMNSNNNQQQQQQQPNAPPNNHHSSPPYALSSASHHNNNLST